MPETIYIETSIFSFYYDPRPDAKIQAMRQWTREWWDHHRHAYELFTSLPVLDELEQGTLPHRAQALALAAALPALEAPVDVDATVAFYIRHHVMPDDPLGDALHLALASHARCDFLLTWNCRHLANAHKFGHIRHVNTVLGLHVPALVTPLQLLGVGDESQQ